MTSMRQTPAEPPVYAATETKLREFVVAEGLQPGARLPAERELARQLGVSRTSLRQALFAFMTTSRSAQTALGWATGPATITCKVQRRSIGFLARYPTHLGEAKSAATGVRFCRHVHSDDYFSSGMSFFQFKN